MKKLLTILLVVLLVFSLVACGTQKSAVPAAEDNGIGDSLVLYTSMTESDIDALLTCFAEIYPDVDVEIVSGRVGELTAKITAEKDNPQGDLVWGGLQDSDGDTYADLYGHWVSEYCKDNLPDYISCNDFYSINHLSPVCFCVNLELEKELGIEIKSYADLLNPALKGKVILSDPNSSSAAWNNLCNMFAVYGFDTDEAWNYIEQFMENVVIVNSSSMCFNSVNDGEYVCGLTYEDGAVKLLANGSTAVEMRYPEEGTSASAFAAAVIKGAPHMDAAKAMVDFVCSPEGQTRMSEYMEGTLRFTNTKMKVSEKSWLPDSATLKWVPRPVAELTANKAQILEHWNSLLAEVQK